jgi:2-oxoglutarate dehydrogenase E2 component (dihydrolipoamide succinyltransferase)
MRGDSIVYRKGINIGVAVAIPTGLIVPVIHGVENMSLAGIARALQDKAERARAGKLLPADIEGGTFTVTSPGQLGATMATPIINQPQAAILHMGAIQKTPAVIETAEGDDVIVIRQRAMLTLGFDHRIIDGWDADSFMAALRARIEGVGSVE